ncbi:MAG: hypothetical protein IKB08_00520 [Clostridia bacterium]|nr:hypothetical protein [Clostridia bacterium]
MKKIISVILAVSMLFSVGVTGVFAKTPERADVIFAESEADIKALDRDIPVVEVPGFGEIIYKGLDTEDESDDISLFGPDMGVLLPSLFKNLPAFLAGILFRNFDLVDNSLGPFMLDVFSDLGCNPDGTVKEGTGTKRVNMAEPKDEYGYRNSYVFRFDWRKDMHTLAGELNEYIELVKDVTDSEKIAIVAFSQGNCVVMTYLYEYYYIESDPDKRDDIDAVIFMCGAMNGVGSCEDPISGNIGIDSLSLLRFIKVALEGNLALSALYYMVEMLYAVGLMDWLVGLVNDYLDERLENAIDPYLLSSFGALPGFYAMMSPERYEEAEQLMFATPELQEKYAGMIEKNRYYHNEVQANMGNIIDSLMAEGKNVGIIAEYGYPIAPATSDNDRMTDFSICTAQESFGATCSEIDGILGLDYKQAKECECGKNHVSCDLQIDASTCLYPDITWFAKGLKHDAGGRFWADLFDLIIYSERQISVWDYSDYPQFMENYEDSFLVPLTNDGTYATPFEDTLIFGRFRAKGGC